MDVSFEPLHDNVLVKMLPPEDKKTQQGIILPGHVESGTDLAVVVKVGPGLFLDGGPRVKPEVREGDVILLVSNAGLLINLEGEPYEVVRYDNVVGVVSRRDSSSV